jgi:hypothetical protein
VHQGTGALPPTGGQRVFVSIPRDRDALSFAVGLLAMADDEDQPRRRLIG